jgi:hypothetical protein
MRLHSVLPAALAAALAAPTADAQHELLISEAVITPTAGEYIEIFNPNPFVVDLSDVYLTDATDAGDGAFYYNIVTGADAGSTSPFDFHARFPDGASIQPGRYQTIALAGSDAFFNEYGLQPTYELLEDGGVPDAVPDMREALPGSIGSSAGLTNSGEVAILYHWDGQSDLVTDLDYLLWGDQAEAVDKSGVSIDGPDPGSAQSTYQNDTAAADQAFLTPHSAGDSFTRTDFFEGAEAISGGNGVSGEDETSEVFDNTFATGFPPSPNAGLPDTQQIVATFATDRSQQGEGSGSADILVNVLTTDALPTEREITVEVTLLNGSLEDADFSDIPPATRTLTFPAGSPSGTQRAAVFNVLDDTLVEGTETGDFSLTAPIPADAPDDFGTTSFTLTILDNDGTPGAAGSLVITEIMYNPRSNDNANGNDVEWFEIVNTTPTAINLANYTLEDRGDGTATFLGGTVQPFGIAVVISDDITVNTFQSAWDTGFNIVQLDFDQFDGFNNSPGDLNEALILRDAAASVIDSVNFTDDAPWPADDNRSSIYLNVPNSQIIASGAGLNDDGASWALSSAGVNGAFTSTSAGPFGGQDVGSPGLSNGDSVVPVELAQPLTARLTDGGVELTWSTASETNNAYFEVLARPLSEEAFVSLGRVDGAGTTSEARAYRLRTTDLAPGTYQFRLRQVDLDGTAVVASEVEFGVEMTEMQRVSAVWPNPSVGHARLSLATAQAQRVTVTVYDALGRSVGVVLDERVEGQSAREVALPAALSAGLYIVEVRGESFREVRRFHVVR